MLVPQWCYDLFLVIEIPVLLTVDYHSLKNISCTNRFPKLPVFILRFLARFENTRCLADGIIFCITCETLEGWIDIFDDAIVISDEYVICCILHNTGKFLEFFFTPLALGDVVKCSY